MPAPTRKQMKGSAQKVFAMPYDDFTAGRRSKSAMILNPHNYPVVVNEDGQTLGGMKTGKCLLADSVLKGAIEKGLVLVLSSE